VHRLTPASLGIQTCESVIEVDYGAQIVPWLTLRPNLQYVRHPAGTGSIANTLVAGLYAQVTFGDRAMKSTQPKTRESFGFATCFGFLAAFFLHRQACFGRRFEPGARNRLIAEIRVPITALLDLLQCSFDKGGIMNIENHGWRGMFPGMAMQLRRNWSWLLALGIGLFILGLIALVDSFFVTVVSMLFFGWILIIAGIIEGVQAIRHRKHGHLFVHALNAVLAIVVGALLVWKPLAGAVVMTLLLAVYFIVAGIFRIINALSVRVAGWGWALVSGIIGVILGILIWAQWPVSGLWVIGLFIGIDLIIVGWSQIMTAIAARAIRTP
jgi:uncharacterized membrane protein HdeD (DUF308 family)